MAQLTHNYSGSCTVYANISQVLDHLEDFAEEHLGEWKPTGGTDGRKRFTVRLKQIFSVGVDLKPGNIVTWFEDAYKRDRHRKRSSFLDPYIREKPVRYKYTVKIEFMATKSRETLVSFETIEEVDPGHNIPRKLGSDFKVPQMPENLGRIGEKFLDSLRFL